MTHLDKNIRHLRLPSEAEMRRAIAARDSAYDGRFLYGVITTGIYCRPSCKARPARPENVRFFADAAEARKAGLRPCKRCRPDDAETALATLTRIAAHIRQHADEPMRLASLARMAALSPSRFQRAFTSAFGVSPKAFQEAERHKRLKSALKSGDGVAGAIFEAGYGSTSRVYGAARSIGMTPGAYRAGGKGETLTHACRATPFGALLMAATARGVAFAEFGEGEEALVRQLRAEFPHAELVPSPGGAALDAWVEALVDHLARRTPRPDLPLDLRGTAFQIKVWRFLLSVPEGSVVTYSEVAEAIGAPKAVRAAASANAANRIAVLVPCHRALRVDGGLGGYRWGLEVKRALLDAERAGRP